MKIHDKMREWNESRRVYIDDAELQRLFDDGATAKEIAEAFGCSTHPVKVAMRRLGLRRPAKRRQGVGIGQSNPAWKGGRRVRRDGYVMVRVRDKERLEHRVVVERHLGRALSDSEIVHHKDGDKQNNQISNLSVMSRAEHAALHAPEMHAARYGR